MEYYTYIAGLRGRGMFDIKFQSGHIDLSVSIVREKELLINYKCRNKIRAFFRSIGSKAIYLSKKTIVCTQTTLFTHIRANISKIKKKLKSICAVMSTTNTFTRGLTGEKKRKKKEVKKLTAEELSLPPLLKKMYQKENKSGI